MLSLFLALFCGLLLPPLFLLLLFLYGSAFPIIL
jgi:hypothetical protein